MTDNAVPEVRICDLNHKAVNPDGQFVLYWMTANRRLRYNFALQRAVEWCRQLRRPLVILEALRCDYPWASDRLHAFVLQGMNENAQAATAADVCYLPYVEAGAGNGRGLFETLARDACVAVADDFPCFFLPAITRSAATMVSCLMESVDANGLLPMRAANQVFTTAHSFRRFLQKSLGEHLRNQPLADPLKQASLPGTHVLLSAVADRWPAATADLLTPTAAALSRLPIDHQVVPGPICGGAVAAGKQLKKFLQHRLNRYDEDRNHPDDDASSGLSPYLHFGHISSAEIFARLCRREGWSPDLLGDARDTRGGRQGWWGMSPSAESFLDELVTWRELGFNMCWQRSDYDQYESLPNWAQQTLKSHAGDLRPVVYSQQQLESAETHDPIWNAAQRQLVREGRIQNYLRMLWGKKILEWTPAPREALRIMIELNNRFAIDGRDPNSYSGIFWVLGRYDRAWGPERPIFGKIRYMTSDSAARKLRLKQYLQRYSAGDEE